MIAGRYRVERILGAGGMATVYLAYDQQLDRPVAVKVLAENLAAEDDLRRRFLREARLAAALAHPNVVRVFGTGEDEAGLPFIVMEYVEGETLAELLRRRGRLPAPEVRGLVGQAAAGLAHAHAAGLVHRDVKPQNLLLAGDGCLKVADFGIARVEEGTRLTQAGTVLGTAAYIAPEQLAGEPVSAAADVYSLGAVFYELLTGRPPHLFDSFAELAAKQQEPVRVVRELAPDVPEQLEELVMRCLALKPQYRPTTADVASVATGVGEPATVPLASEQPTSVIRRRVISRPRAAAAAAAVVAVAALAVALPLTLGGHNQPKAPTVPRVAPVAPAATPAKEARNLAAWLRRYSR
jgi:eukaryotic-like serine/threonine-protein kinase